MPFPNMPSQYSFKFWDTIMELVVNGFRISTLPLDQVREATNPTVFFVMKNTMNTLLGAVLKATESIVDMLGQRKNQNMNTFLYLLITASAALFFSLIFLIPVINKVKKNKQEVLELFTHRNIEKHIDE